MKLQRIALLSAIGVLVAACSSDTGPHVTNLGPLAYVRYVNAIPDTNQTDFRFVDQVSGSPWFGQLFFRDISSYEPVAPGARHIRIFAVDPNVGTTLEANINVVSSVFVDTTITLQANTYYTLVHVGYARAGASPAQHLVVIQEDRSTLPSGTQIGVRAINTSPTMTADVYAAATASGSPLISALPFGSASPYQLLNTGSLTFTATANGSKTVTASAAAPAGAPPASISQSATAGYSVGGSLLSAYIFPAAVTGSLAGGTNQANTNCYVNKADLCTKPGVTWINDNFPQMPGAGT